MAEHFNHLGTMLRRQIEQHALAPEAFAQLTDQLGQVNVFGIDLVDHQHPAQPALARQAHHALGHQLDAVLRIHHHQRCIDPSQGADRLTGKIGISRGVDHVDARRLPIEAGHGGTEGVPELFFLRIEIADRIAFLHGSARRDGTRRREQRFSQRGLAGGAVPNECYGTKVFGAVVTHVLPHR